MDTSILEDIGLTPSEIKAYIALLESGIAHAGLLMEKSKLQNSVLHRALNSLIEKGLISFIMEGKRKLYQATDPENFYFYMEDKKTRFEQLLPELKKRQMFSIKTEGATVYKGRRGINEIYTKLLNSGKEEYNTYGGGSRVTYDIMGESWWNNLHIKRIEKAIPSRQIFDETIRKFGESLNKKRLTKIKFVSGELEQLTETVIKGDLVAINIFTENPYGILIEDKTVADGYRKYFELMWKRANQ